VYSLLVLIFQVSKNRKSQKVIANELH